MPRIFDYDNKDPVAKAEAYDRGDPFALLPDELKGNKEIDLSLLWGPKGIFFFDGEHHQFERKMKDSTKTYVNDAANTTFRWLDNELVGRWHWLERSCNHGHSVMTLLWIEREEDVAKVREHLADEFEFNIRTQEENELRRVELQARSEDVLPPELTPTKIGYLLHQPDEACITYLKKLQEWEEGPEMLVRAVDLIEEGYADLEGAPYKEVAEGLAEVLCEHVQEEHLSLIKNLIGGRRSTFASALLSGLTSNGESQTIGTGVTS